MPTSSAIKKKKGGFSAAELAAAQWRRQVENKSKEKSRRSASPSSSSSEEFKKKKKKKRAKRKNHIKKEKEKRRKRRKRRRKDDSDTSETSSSSESEGKESVSSDPSRIPRNPLNAAYDTRAYSELKKKRKKGEEESSQPEWTHDGYDLRSPSPRRERTEGAMWNSRKNAWISRAGGAYIPPRPETDDDTEKLARWKHPEDFARYGRGGKTRRNDSRSPSSQHRKDGRDSPVYVLD